MDVPITLGIFMLYIRSIYEVITLLPIEESRNLQDQMRRSVTSLPLNIAEGACSKTMKLYLNHLNYTYASAQELTVALMLCYKLKYIDKQKIGRPSRGYS